MNLGNNLKNIRKEHNLSQEQFAEALGVSRQSVSKWESGLAYPETDKLLAISKMYNVNIDELMNQDYKEISETKQSTSAINKYIDDFLAYVTKTIDMFSAMKFKSKIKCLFEIAFIIFILFMIGLIVGSIGNTIVSDLLSFLPNKVSWFLHSVVADIYILAALVLGAILVFHIFKTRYLDYYTIVKDTDVTDENESNKETTDSKKDYIVLEKKKEKIVIRDPEHSGYKFITGLAKSLLFFIKILVVFIALGFCFSLICFVASLVISFIFLKTGLMFVGAVLILIACIVINILILDVLYNFIVSKKCKKKVLFISFITSLLVFGIGCGLCAIAATDFNIKEEEIIKEEKTIAMKNDLIIADYYGLNYIENNSNDIKIVTKHSSYYKPIINTNGNVVSINYEETINKMDIIREQIKLINNKQISDRYTYTTDIYTSKDNIKKLRHNLNKYYEYNYE